MLCGGCRVVTMGKEVVMGLWGRIYQWGSGSVCGAVM